MDASETKKFTKILVFKNLGYMVYLVIYYAYPVSNACINTYIVFYGYLPSQLPNLPNSTVTNHYISDKFWYCFKCLMMLKEF